MKRILAIVLIIIIIISSTIFASGTEIKYNNLNTLEKPAISEDSYIPSEKSIETINCEIIHLEDLSLKELKDLMNEQLAIKEEIHLKAERLRSIGYSDNSNEILKIKERWFIADKTYNDCKEIYGEKLCKNYSVKIKEYPVATYVWCYLKELGYNDAVCAGIIGNMMLECGGNTLNLDWDIYGGYGFYGLCQWSKEFFPEVYGVNLENQMNCLRDTIKREIDYAGFVYGGYGFNYEDFLNIEDPGEAALCFALSYERCASQHVWPRKGYAEQAYKYFIN